MADTTTYSGAGTDLQAAILTAHEAYKKAASARDPSKDMFTTKVVSIGVETGGFVPSTTFLAEVQEAPHRPRQKT